MATEGSTCPGMRPPCEKDWDGSMGGATGEDQVLWLLSKLAGQWESEERVGSISVEAKPVSGCVHESKTRLTGEELALELGKSKWAAVLALVGMLQDKPPSAFMASKGIRGCEAGIAAAIGNPVFPGYMSFPDDPGAMQGFLERPGAICVDVAIQFCTCPRSRKSVPASGLVVAVRIRSMRLPCPWSGKPERAFWIQSGADVLCGTNEENSWVMVAWKVSFTPKGSIFGRSCTSTMGPDTVLVRATAKP